ELSARSLHTPTASRDPRRMRLLVVADERRITAVLRPGLGELGYVVAAARVGVIGPQHAPAATYNTTLLAILLPPLHVLGPLRAFAVLEYLLRHPGQALSRTQIAERVWSWEFHGDSNIIDVYIGYLRRKLDAAGEPSAIETLRGFGYRLRNEAQRA